MPGLRGEIEDTSGFTGKHGEWEDASGLNGRLGVVVVDISGKPGEGDLEALEEEEGLLAYTISAPVVHSEKQAQFKCLSGTSDDLFSKWIFSLLT